MLTLSKETETDRSFVEINGYPGYYINKTGQVKSTLTGKEIILRQLDSGNGYKQVCLCRLGKREIKKIHRLMAVQFLDFDNSLQVNHIDGNKHNNSITNLEMTTRGKNMSHASKLGLIPVGEKHHNSKITKEIVIAIRSSKEKLSILADRYGMNSSHVHSVRIGKIWKHV